MTCSVCQWSPVYEGIPRIGPICHGFSRAIAIRVVILLSERTMAWLSVRNPMLYKGTENHIQMDWNRASPTSEERKGVYHKRTENEPLQLVRRERVFITSGLKTSRCYWWGEKGCLSQASWNRASATSEEREGVFITLPANEGSTRFLWHTLHKNCEGRNLDAFRYLVTNTCTRETNFGYNPVHL